MILLIIFLHAIAAISADAVDESCDVCSKKIIQGLSKDSPLRKTDEEGIIVRIGKGFATCYFHGYSTLELANDFKTCPKKSGDEIKYEINGVLDNTYLNCYFKTEDNDIIENLFSVFSDFKHLAAHYCPAKNYLTNATEITRDKALKFIKLHVDKCRKELDHLYEVTTQRSSKGYDVEDNEVKTQFYFEKLGVKMQVHVQNGKPHIANVELVGSPKEEYTNYCKRTNEDEKDNDLSLACRCLVEHSAHESFAKAIIRYMLACQSQRHQFKQFMKVLTCDVK